MWHDDLTGGRVCMKTYGQRQHHLRFETVLVTYHLINWVSSFICFFKISSVSIYKCCLTTVENIKNFRQCVQFQKCQSAIIYPYILQGYSCRKICYQFHSIDIVSQHAVTFDQIYVRAKCFKRTDLLLLLLHKSYLNLLICEVFV